jgi:hypothetical protein
MIEAYLHINMLCQDEGFYPELTKVGKKVLKDQVQYRYAVDPRFVESGGVKNPATPALAWSRSSNMRLYAAQSLVL